MQMAVFMKEILYKTEPKEKVCLLIPTVQNTKATGKIIRDKVVESSNGKTDKDMMETGSIIKSKAMENCTLEMEAFTKVNLTLIKYMVRVSIHGRNRKNMRVNGSIIR